MRFRGAVLVESHKPLVVATLEHRGQLEYGQVWVKLLYTTICGSQLNEIDAVKGPDKFLPHLLGHEASAIVEMVGPGVTRVQRGDHVVLHWRKADGIQSRPPHYYWRDSEIVNAGWVTTFQEQAIVSENRCTPIPSDLDMTTAPLLGCALTTAMGVVENDAKIEAGNSVVVIGVGGVGLAIVQMAHLAGAHPIVAIDVRQDKLDRAKAHGATIAFNSYDSDSSELAQGIIYQLGETPDRVIETTGRRHLIEMAYELASPVGRGVTVGVCPEKISINQLKLHHGFVWTGSEGGSSVPDVDIPRLIRLEKAGRIKFNDMITHTFHLEDINKAIDMVRKGDCGRVEIILGGK